MDEAAGFEGSLDEDDGLDGGVTGLAGDDGLDGGVTELEGTDGLELEADDGVDGGVIELEDSEDGVDGVTGGGVRFS